MEKTYNPHAIEQRWYHVWERQGHFVPAGKGEPYCIMIPPPNVTGTLHMGHAFQDTLMDALIRYHRMRGDNTLWQPGTDHAGIATQMVVERQLNAEGKTQHDVGREAFVQRVWEWKHHSGNTITRQLRRMGASVDWSRERFTMDESLSRAVREVFVRLYEEGLIYRGQRLVNWDPVLHTALSDLEVVANEENGHLWHMRYPLADGEGHLVVATTRPETMLGDTAVAVHPQDERYRQLMGKSVQLPLANRPIPIIADEYVDPEFGSGCVKITPGHDFNDYEVGTRHNLPLINIFTDGARVNLPGPYQGMDRYEARERIVADLEQQGLLDKVETHKLMVPRGDRSHAVVEPYLTDQWFVKIKPLAEPAIRAVEDGRIRFVPENWAKTYFEWMRNIQDWCISRQLWWGHRIPVWYCADCDQDNVRLDGLDMTLPDGAPIGGGTIKWLKGKGISDEEAIRKAKAIHIDENATPIVSESEPQRCPKCGGSRSRLVQDPDVLDTWFSSALWPFSTLGWPDETAALKTFYPTSVLVTGFDIIFFWVARMIMMGLKFMGDVPFRQVYITGLVRDAEGQKMSKSKGNVLDPIDLVDGIDVDGLVAKLTAGLMQPQMAQKIEQTTHAHYPNGIPTFGTDALRFTFAALASTGRDIKFDLNRIEGYRNFCNKLWNAARYVLMNTEGEDTGIHAEPVQLSLPERWIISRLQAVTSDVCGYLDSYRFDLAAQAVYDFVWHDYCDWYLELSKPILHSDASLERKRGTRQTLVRVLETLLRLTHPLMPFISEEIWQQVAPLAGKQGKTIVLQPYPAADESYSDHEAEHELEWVKAFIMCVRRIRSERDIAPGKPLPVLLQNWTSEDRDRYERNAAFIRTLAKLENTTWLDDMQAPEAAICLVGELKVLVPLAGMIDKQAELARLQRELDKLRGKLEKSEAKLQNPNFVERAPAAVVQKERARVEDMRTSLRQLEEEAEKIRGS